MPRSKTEGAQKSNSRPAASQFAYPCARAQRNEVTSGQLPITTAKVDSSRISRVLAPSERVHGAEAAPVAKCPQGLSVVCGCKKHSGRWYPSLIREHTRVPTGQVLSMGLATNEGNVRTDKDHVGEIYGTRNDGTASSTELQRPKATWDPQHDATVEH